MLRLMGVLAPSLHRESTDSLIGIAMHGWSSIIAIHKEISVFTFSFNLNLSFKDIKVENM